eukprot:gene11473-32200_t
MTLRGNSVPLFSPPPGWYVDVIMRVIQEAGSYVAPDVWQRIVQIVTNNEDIQKQAAQICMRSLHSLNCHETCVKVASHVLGEYGYMIQDETKCSCVEQFNTLNRQFPLVSNECRALLMNTYVKFYTIVVNGQVLRLTPSAYAGSCRPDGPREEDPRFVATVIGKTPDGVRLRWHSAEDGGPPPSVPCAAQEARAWFDGDGQAVYARPAVLDPKDGFRDIREKVRKAFDDNRHHMNVEIQQRACEYQMMTNPRVVTDATMEQVLENMPPFNAENTAKVFESVIAKGQDTTDSNLWQQKREERERGMIAEMKEQQEVRQSEMEAEKAAQDAEAQALATWAEERARLPSIAELIAAAQAKKGLAGVPAMHGDHVLHRIVDEEEVLENRTRLLSIPSLSADAQREVDEWVAQMRGQQAAPIDTSEGVARSRATFAAILGTNQGLLYEDALLQSPAPFDGCSVDGTSDNPALAIKTQPVQPQWAPGTQTQTGPTVRICLQSQGRAMDLTLPLPISVSRFVEPMPLQSPAQFVQAWQQTAGTQNPPKWQIYAWHTTGAVDLDKSQALLESMRLKVLRAVALLESMRLKVLRAVALLESMRLKVLRA